MEETDLGRRIRTLEDVEAIEKLKARYWYCIERKLWNELLDVFAKDAIAHMGDRSLKGREAVVKHLEERLSLGTNLHRGHSPIIEITSDTTATGKWDLHDSLTFGNPALKGFESWGSYEDEHVKEEGKWKIKSYKYTHSRIEWWNNNPKGGATTIM